MTSNYPGALDTFVNPSGTSTQDNPDHAGQHTNINDSMVKVQLTVGTTAGTNVLKNFNAGDFPSRINASNILQQTIAGGTINASILGTPSITGGTINLAQIKTSILGSAVYTGTASTTQTIDLSLATRHLVNMSNSAGSVTLAISNVTPNQPFFIEVLQGTAGLGTINWFSTIRWSGSAVPTQTLTASRKDTFGFIPTSASTFDGYIVGQNL